MKAEKKTIVIALGGNAIQKEGSITAESQKKIAADVATQLVPLIKDGHQLVIVHGNGPQVGDIFSHMQSSSTVGRPDFPLDTCVAMSQGEIGYWLQQALQNELAAQHIAKHTATIITQVVVDQNDDAFHDPTKPIGPFYKNQATAEAAAQKLGFTVKEDAGRGWRCVAPSPMPIDILEKNFIHDALQAGNVVIAAGGGGVPVTRQANSYMGVSAVIDKDFAAEKLAELLHADTLLILTTVDAVSINFRKPTEKPLETATVRELQQYIAQREFAPGSMLPKVEASITFATLKPGNTAIITSPANTIAAINGKAGTRIIRDNQEVPGTRPS